MSCLKFRLTTRKVAQALFRAFTENHTFFRVSILGQIDFVLFDRKFLRHSKYIFCHTVLHVVRGKYIQEKKEQMTSATQSEHSSFSSHPITKMKGVRGNN